MAYIEVENLCFTYPSEEHKALNNISFSAEKGEFITICGKSGCGKSTLLRHLKPAITPAGERSGRITFNGQDINELSLREQAQKIGFVFQNPDSQIVCDKVWHELAFGLESLSFKKEEIRLRVAEMSAFFGITEWFYKNTDELSGGQKQLLNLASVMVMQPEVIILDEPTGQLDPISAEEFLSALRKINHELGVTVILTEHKLAETFSFSDRVMVMTAGEILSYDEPLIVAKELYDKKDAMFLALPTQIRIYYSKENPHKCPKNLREGRNWITLMNPQKEIDVKEDAKKGEEVLFAEDVWYRYEKDLPYVLKGFDINLYKGELFAIVGSNGSGKTTALSVLGGIYKTLRGKIKIKEGLKIISLPQNPQSLFLKNTVMDELYDLFSSSKLSEEEKDKKVKRVIDLCNIKNLLGRHPFDLSGGEAQRVALCKVLLKEPDILLLDEPTKGLDESFKRRLANILKSLKEQGVTILMVSHDIEFCALYADRCGMFFDGRITSLSYPREFFKENSFYTTLANKMSRGIIEGAVLDEDIISAIGGTNEIIKEDNEDFTIPYDMKKEKDKKKLTPKNIITGSVFAFLFASLQFLLKEFKEGALSYILGLLSVLFFGVAISNFIPQREIGEEDRKPLKEKKKVKIKSLISAILILLMIPTTIWVGNYFLEDRKYYFISILIIVETLFAFFTIFEGRGPKAREIVIISVLCALGVVGRTAFFMLPQFKPVLALVIISGICFGGEAGFLVGAITAFVSNFFFGQTPFTPWQMFALGIIGFLAGVLTKSGILRRTKTAICMFGFLSAIIIYGGIMNPASVIVGQGTPTKEMILSSFVFGLPFDLTHGISTAFFLYFVAEPMVFKLNRIKIKYNLAG